MKKVLGLDLGTNSIGWALVDQDNGEILGMGSRIFPEGVVDLGQGDREMSKNSSRTDARGTRRQFFRRRLRKKILLKELSRHNMCPLTTEDIQEWKENKRFPEEKLRDWFALNPYELRAKALKKELSLHEIGRVFYHLIQRRGFQSNSRSANSDETGAIFEGKDDKIGIAQTQESIASNDTLGSYLNEIVPKEFEPFKQGRERVRNRYTTRKMYIDEFERIWKHQEKYHKELTHELKTLLGGRKKDGYESDGVLFHQRPLRSQKNLVGKCSFEPTKTKCPISAIPFEKFRVYQWVNTVDCNVKLTDADKEILVNQLFSKEKVTFSMLRKALKRADSAYQFNYKDDDQIVGTHTISKLSNKKFFGERWFDLTEKEQEDIWHVFYFFEDKDKLKEYAIKNWGFDEEKADEISRFNLKQGYASLSRKAINNILPFLEQGYQYDVAVALGGIKNAFGSRWGELKNYDLELLDSNIFEIVRQGKKGGYINNLKDFLKSEFDLSEKILTKLYHHSSNIDHSELLDRLPVDQEADKEIQSIRNPIVITALFEIRRLVNELIDDYGKPNEIKIELARDLKISKSKRRLIRLEQQRLERENDRVKKELERHGQRITHDNLLKYKLWEECNQTCPYTGKPINITQLFSGEVQIEHIHPWSRSLNDSFMNKTVCFADENREKGNKTPFEFYSIQGDEKWEQVKAQALSCFKNKKEYPNAYVKFKHFIRKKHDDDFISRQLNDTRYISKEAKNYLSKICPNVHVYPGQVTASLRHHWGLNTILNDENKKSRDDHRHHAVDALVVACTTHSHLNELAKWNSYDRNYELKTFPMPWDNFRIDAEKKTNEILVSHKKHNPVLTIRASVKKQNGTKHVNTGIAARGQLHMETVYGKRKSPEEETHSYHVRKPIESLTTIKHVEKVVDPVIRKLIHERVESMGGYEKGKNIPKNAFFEADEEGVVHPMIFLPNRNGEKVPVRKVRIRENLTGAEKLKENVNKFVNPRNNHHVLIYIDENGKLKEEVVSFWTVVERKKQGVPVYQLPEGGIEIITTLEANDMFLLELKTTEFDLKGIDHSQLNRHLYRVQKISECNYMFREHLASTLDKKSEEIHVQSLRKFESLSPVKVKVSPTGKITRVNQ